MATSERSLLHLRSDLKPLEHQRLWLQVLVGMGLGIAFGILIGPTAGLVDPKVGVLIGNWVALPGRLFLLAIQFVVVPLVVASVIRGIAANGDGEGLGALGLRTILFFVATTLLAAAIGLVAASVVTPGAFIDSQTASVALGSGTPAEGMSSLPEAKALPKADEIPDIIASLFPKDPLTTFVSGNMLQIVMTAAILGVALVMTPAEQRKPLLDLMASIQAAAMAIVGWVLRFAPVAVFGLLAHIAARVGFSALIGTAMYVVTVVLGLAILMLVYLGIARLLVRQPIRPLIAATREVLLLAFSTSSSAAVMPLTLATAENALHVRSSTARFVIPLGTTINMGGTALYQGVAALFLAQVFGIDIGFIGMVLIVVMATGAAIGSPGTPGVGIVILATILDSVGIPAAGIAIILGVDRLLDMCRTVVNVTGDIVAALTIDHIMKTPEEREEAHLARVMTPGMRKAE